MVCSFNLFQLLDVKFSNLVVKAENDAEDALKKRREQLGVYMVIFPINKSYARVVNNQWLSFLTPIIQQCLQL